VTARAGCKNRDKAFPVIRPRIHFITCNALLRLCTHDHVICFSILLAADLLLTFQQFFNTLPVAETVPSALFELLFSISLPVIPVLRFRSSSESGPQVPLYETLLKPSGRVTAVSHCTFCPFAQLAECWKAPHSHKEPHGALGSSAEQESVP
jgi:hypothetical protein